LNSGILTFGLAQPSHKERLLPHATSRVAYPAAQEDVITMNVLTEG
jgi:hypothetical protein